MTKHSATVHTTATLAADLDDAFVLADAPHRGPVFLDLSLEAAFDVDAKPLPTVGPRKAAAPDPDSLAAIGDLLARAAKPVLVLGSDVWMDDAEAAALAFAEETGVPVITNGMGRGILPRGHRQLVTRARSAAFGGADLVIVVGTPLDFRLGYGQFGSADNRHSGGRDGRPLAPVVHLVDSPGQISGHIGLAASAAGDLSAAFEGIAQSWRKGAKPGAYADWLAALQDKASAAIAADRRAADRRLRPDPPGPHLRRAAAAAGRRRGRDRRRRRLRVLRRPVRGAGPRGLLAGPGPVRLPGHGPGLRDRGRGWRGRPRRWC